MLPGSYLILFLIWFLILNLVVVYKYSICFWISPKEQTHFWWWKVEPCPLVRKTQFKEDVNQVKYSNGWIGFGELRLYSMFNLRIFIQTIMYYKVCCDLTQRESEGLSCCLTAVSSTRQGTLVRELNDSDWLWDLAFKVIHVSHSTPIFSKFGFKYLWKVLSPE